MTFCITQSKRSTTKHSSQNSKNADTTAWICEMTRRPGRLSTLPDNVTWENITHYEQFEFSSVLFQTHGCNITCLRYHLGISSRRYRGSTQGSRRGSCNGGHYMDYLLFRPLDYPRSEKVTTANHLSPS